MRNKINIFILLLLVSSCSSEIFSSDSSEQLEDSTKAWCINWSSNPDEILQFINDQDISESTAKRYYYDGPRVSYWFKSFKTSANLVDSNILYEDSIIDSLNKGQNSDFLDAFDIFSEKIQDIDNQYVRQVCNIWHESTDGVNFLFD
jgi:hypothetical protein|tara:strand:- start:451 stop:891 length:441 start_codon:yes stop_codon:yes gene_type:complete